MNDRAKILDPSGHPISTNTPISVLKSRNPVPENIVKAICVATNSNVVVLPWESDLLTGKFAMEALEYFHKVIHQALGIKEDKKL